MKGATVVCVCTDLCVLKGTETHVYDTESGRWEKKEPLSSRLAGGRGCMISECYAAVHTKEGMYIGQTMEAIRERSKLEAEVQRLAADRKAALTSLLVKYGYPEETHPYLSDRDIIGILAVALSALESERQSEDALFTSFTSDRLSDLAECTEAAKAFDVDALHTHNGYLAEYLPVAESLAKTSRALRQYMDRHPVDKLVSEDCATLHTELSTLYDQFQRDHTALKGFEFSTDSCLARISEAQSLLSAISSHSVIPLPSNMGALTLAGKHKFCLVERYNTGVRGLYECAMTVLECQACIEECSASLCQMDTPDIETCAALESECQALMQSLCATAAGIHQYTEDEECEVAMLEVKLKMKCSLAPEERATLQREIDTRKASVTALRETSKQRAQIVERLTLHI
ncbi:hypothetical protein KIPB_009551 [Kipferlia bialata]|uniref:Uncharacterized protein n=1 Tax=Kipferlia bialata TaxID=797122 RepID=A0A9K3D444_9EUKA|nr:hypothetical protein KIPB_009551 [Kipferlia bialata]|eukprot:g9551.t1